MATSKQYAYYLEGNKLAIVEKDVSFDNDINNKDYGPGASSQRWESPQSTVDNGIKIKYTYAKTWYVDNTVTHYGTHGPNSYRGSTGGFLELVDLDTTSDGGSAYTDFDTLMDIGEYFLLEDAGRWNGIHKVTGFDSLIGTNNVITTDTLYDGSTVPLTFDTKPAVRRGITRLQDESFELDLPTYLQKALVYYVKAKLAEDAGELKLREYSMREFKKMIEKHENSRISGLRIISPGSHSIR